MNRRIFIACLLLSLALQVAPAQQPEPAVLVTEGLEPTLIAYGTHTTSAALSPAVDVDTFTFTGTSGDLIRIRLRSGTLGLDPHVRLFDPAGGLLADVTGVGNTPVYVNANVNINETLPMTGTYTIVVDEAGLDETGTYVIQLEVLPPSTPVPQMTFGVPISDTLDRAVDIDFFEFPAITGSLLQFNAQSNSDGLDLHVQIFDPNMNLVLNQFCVGNAPVFVQCAFAASLTLTVPGTYLVVVFDNGHDESGNYTLSIHCLVGCPGSPSTTLPGSNEDLLLATGVGTSPTVHPDVKPAVPGDILTVYFQSPGGTFDFLPPALIAEGIPTGATPFSPVGFPEVHLNPLGAMVLFDGNAPGFNLTGTLPPQGVTFHFDTSGVPPGTTVVIQAAAITPSANNGFFAITDGHQIVF